jgi:quinol monooxygenase YgiN
MFIRVFHAKVRPGKQAEFKKTLELLTLPNIQYRNGMIAFYPGQPVGPNSNEFVLVTVWKDAPGLNPSSGSDWAKAIVPAEALPLLEEWHEHDYKAFGVLEPQLQPLFQSI